jgi:nucleotide-binding universal stress UspA family protein
VSASGAGSSGTIVCGVDHSPGARNAAKLADGLAGRLGSRLLLIHAVPLPLPSREAGVAPPTSFVMVDQMRAAGVTLLEEIAGELDAAPGIERRVQIGGAAEVIAAAAEDAGAELVVVGSRGLGSVGALLLGSVSRSLATRGPCPALIVPDSTPVLGDGPIVCAVDESEGAGAALSAAADLAGRLDVQLLVVTVEANDGPSPAAVERLVSAAGLGMSTRTIVTHGEPAAAIVEAAGSHGAGMIVIGSRGRGALAASVLGSVSSSVAGRSERPVLVVRGRG